jgi:SagB-type dehydrogenase family enzyme
MIKDIGYEFLIGSSYKNMPETDQSKGMPQPQLETKCDLGKIPLPQINSLEFNKIDLKDAIINRKSNRIYTNEPISIEELSYALYMTQGVKRVVEQRATFRTVPSAGARHPFDTYVAINYVNGLESGLYRYVSISHELAQIEKSKTFGASLAEASLNQSMVKDAAVTFIWVADSYRTTYRYGMRGYRYIFLDAGHVSQNLYLVAEQLGLGTCAIAAYDDDMVNNLMKLDGKDYFVVYMAPFGKIK